MSNIWDDFDNGNDYVPEKKTKGKGKKDIWTDFDNQPAKKTLVKTKLPGGITDIPPVVKIPESPLSYIGKPITSNDNLNLNQKLALSVPQPQEQFTGPPEPKKVYWYGKNGVYNPEGKMEWVREDTVPEADKLDIALNSAFTGGVMNFAKGMLGGLPVKLAHNVIDKGGRLLGNKPIPYNEFLKTAEQGALEAGGGNEEVYNNPATKFIGQTTGQITGDVMLLNGIGELLSNPIMRGLINKYPALANKNTLQGIMSGALTAPGFTLVKKATEEGRPPTADEFAKDLAFFMAFPVGSNAAGKAVGKVAPNAPELIKRPIEGALGGVSGLTATAPFMSEEERKNLPQDALSTAASMAAFHTLRPGLFEKNIPTSEQPINQPTQEVANEPTTYSDNVEIQPQNIEQVRRQQPIQVSELEPVVKRYGFNTVDEAYYATTAKEKGYEWIKSEMPNITEPEYKNLVEKYDAIPESEKDQFKFNLQLFAKNNPSVGKLFSQSRTNIIENTTELSDDVKAELDPTYFEYDPETVKDWQNKATTNIQSNKNEVFNRLGSKDTLTGGVETTEASMLIKELATEAEKSNSEFAWQNLVDFTKNVTGKLRESARALTAWGNSWEKIKSPEAAVIEAQKTINKTQEEILKQQPLKDVAVKEGTKKVKKAVNDEIEKAAEELNKKYVPEEELSKRVIATIKEKPLSNESKVLRNMVNELYRVAKESPLPSRKQISNDPFDFLSEAINNKEEYKDVWEKAKLIVKDKFKNEPDALNLLNKYFEKNVPPTYSNSTFDKAVNQAVKELGTGYSELSKLSKEEFEKSLNQIAEKITNKVGIQGEEARILTERIREKVNYETQQNNVLANKIQNALNGGNNSKEKTVVDQIISELFKKYKETTPPSEQTTKRDNIEIIANNIREGKLTREQWYEAKRIIKDRYKENPEVTKFLEEYFGEEIPPAYSESSFNSAINQGFKETETKIGQVIKEYYRGGLQQRQSLVDYLVKRTGLSGEEARMIEQEFKNNLKNQFKTYREKTKENIFKDRIKTDEVKNQFSKVEFLANLGAMQDTRYAEKINAKLNPTLRNIINKSGLKISELIKQDGEKIKFEKEKFLDQLSKDVQVSKADKIRIVQAAEKTFNEMLNKAKFEYFKRMFQERKQTEPKTVLDKVMELINMDAYSDSRIFELIKEKNKIPVLTGEEAKFIYETMKKANSLPEGSIEQKTEIAKAYKVIANKVPKTIGEKLSTIQYMSQLSSVVGRVRDFGANATFNAVENVTDVIGMIPDRLISLYTGNKTKLMPDIKTGIDGYFKGAKEAVSDFKNNVDTSYIGTKFDYSSSRQGDTFKNPVLNKTERAIKFGLTITDRPFYEAAKNQFLKEQMKLNSVSEPTEEMINSAEDLAKYRVFADETVLSNLFSSLKKTLNLVNIKGFGLGELILKYPKIPGNLMSRAIDYSPAGLANSLIDLATAIPSGNLKTPMVQRRIVDKFSRGTVGTGMFLAAMTLYKLGLITGAASDEDSDIRGIKNNTGYGSFRINLTGIKRYVFSGFNEKEALPRNDDFTVDYSWLQPFSIPVSAAGNVVSNLKTMGSNTGNKLMNVFGTVVAAMDGAASPLVEQPILQGVRRMFGGYKSGDVVNNLIYIGLSSPNTFIPSIVNQIRGITDNVKRNTKDADVVQNVINEAKNKIPGLSQTLPEKVDVLGKTQKNVIDDDIVKKISSLVNPLKIQNVKYDKGVKFLIDLYDKTGENIFLPDPAPKKILIGKGSVVLSPEDQINFQKEVGKLFLERVNANSFYLKNTDDERKVELLKRWKNQIQGRVRSKYKIKLKFRNKEG